MTRRFPLLAAALSLFIPLLLVQGQGAKDLKPSGDQKPKPTVRKDQALKGAAVEEPDPLVAQRRITAISLLTALADDARSFKDPALRARVQARAADALWTTEPDRARDLFHRAWEAAEVGDAESARRATEDAQKQMRQSGTMMRRNRRDMRSEVLQIVARRDRKLANEFLQKIEDDAAKQAKDAATDADLMRLSNQWSAPESQAKRIALARALLEDGDVERAMAFAGPVLDRVNKDSINFLSALRQKNPQAADAGFASLLTRAARDPMSDANTVAGLSSYAFTPFLYVTFSSDGGSFAMQDAPPTPAPALSTELRNAFFQVAMGILMKPQPPPGQDTSTSGRSGKYMVIRRLLPLFEQYVPQRAAELRVMMNAVANEEDVARGQGNRAIDRGIAADDAAGDPVKTLQDRIDRAKTSEQRDGIYADVAVSIAGKGDAGARDLANKIEDSEFRKQTLAYVDFELLRAAFQKKDAAEIIRIARTGELTRIQRVWAYTQAARLSSDQARAIDLLQEAAGESRRLEATDPDRARGLVAVANGFSGFDRARAWEFLTEAIKAANGAEGFTGEDGMVRAMLRSKNMATATAAGSPDFNVAEVFGSLAIEDFYRSIELAKTFSGDTPRANATIAVARAILEPKQAGRGDTLQNR
ncbi:MAG TPA: hypothetical protein VN920_15880 [Pyrinomonadaceae bacterium]|nr:hypothetical protein [Pyrinomonadaceae bacterium]